MLARPVRSFAVLALVSVAGCPGPSSDSDAGLDANEALDAPSDAGPSDPCTLEVTPPSCRPRFEGLSASVEVIRDADGVPHVYGESASDTFFASGYLQAHDRLVQMELMRRRALGTRAAILGEGAVDDDTLMRILDIGHWGAVNASELARRSPEQYLLLEAWAAGVNRFLAEVRSGMHERPPGFGAGELDFVPDDWTVDHALAVAKLLLFGNASQIEYDILSSILARYFPDLYTALPVYLPLRDAHTIPPDERPAALSYRPREEGIVPLVPRDTTRPPLPDDAEARMRRFFARFDEVPGLPSIAGGHSNNWAIDGRHTIDGTPMIAGDPHQGFSSPNIFWLHHLHSARPEDGLDVIGWSFLGAPAIQLGHNRHLVWTATTTYPDVMDLWAVRGDEDSIMLGGEELPIVRRTETIEVHGGSPVMVEIETVPGHGVILPRELPPLPITGPGERLLFDWIGFAPTHEAQGFAGFDLAESREDFEAAMQFMEIGTFNFVAADVAGITYVSPPSTPVRSGPITAERTPWTILDGDDPGSLWSGAILTPDQMPHSHGGARGFLVTANNEPFGFNDDGDWFDGPYYFGMYFDPGTRAQRIEDELTRLTTRGSVTLEDLEALQDDTHSILADDFVPPLLAAWDGRATDASLAAYRDRADLGVLVEALRGWDRRMERDASAAVIFQAYSYVLTRRMASDELSALYDPILDAEPMYLLKMTSFFLRDAIPGGDDFFDDGRTLTMVQALEEVAGWLTTRFGGIETSRYRWGDLHGAVFGSVWGAPFQTSWTPTDGGDGTVNVASSRAMDGATIRDRIDTGGGSVYRMVARFRDDGTPEAYFQMPRGVSGIPGNPFYENLQGDWVESHHRRLRYERSEVEDGAAETFTIDP